MQHEQATNQSKRPFQALLEGKTLALTGALDGSDEAEYQLGKIFRAAASRHRLTVEAANCGVLRGGIDIWIKCVREYLKNNELHYRSSQLGMLLSADDEYRATHPHSTFDDED
jgi:hypothetical protein